ncbi:MAG TPA: phosphatase PAP2 family protein [Gemmatimonadaceae bacterium]
MQRRVARWRATVTDSRSAQRLAALGWRAGLIALASLAAIVLAAKVGEDVFTHESGTFDDAVRGWTLAHRTASGFTLFLWITRIGAAGPVVLAAFLVGAWLWRKRGRRVGAALVAAPAAAVGIFEAVKYTFGRQRPVGAVALHITTFAFPSGHATASAAVAPIVGYVLWREGLTRRWVAVTLGAAVPLLIGISRVYLDVHWATDVLGGWAIGLGVAGLSALAYERLRRRLERLTAAG